MSQERILEMLSNDWYLQVKNTAKRWKILTAGSKIDIIMRLKIYKNVGSFRRLAVIFMSTWCGVLSEISPPCRKL